MGIKRIASRVQRTDGLAHALARALGLVIRSANGGKREEGGTTGDNPGVHQKPQTPWLETKHTHSKFT